MGLKRQLEKERLHLTALAIGDDVLRIVLPGQEFDQLHQHQQMKEVKSVECEDLERCPVSS